MVELLLLVLVDVVEDVVVMDAVDEVLLNVVVTCGCHETSFVAPPSYPALQKGSSLIPKNARLLAGCWLKSIQGVPGVLCFAMSISGAPLQEQAAAFRYTFLLEGNPQAAGGDLLMLNLICTIWGVAPKHSKVTIF